jgi:hypothetical protein
LVNQDQVRLFNIKSNTREGVLPNTDNGTIGAMIVFDIEKTRNVQQAI